MHMLGNRIFPLFRGVRAFCSRGPNSKNPSQLSDLLKDLETNQKQTEKPANEPQLSDALKDQNSKPKQTNKQTNKIASPHSDVLKGLQTKPKQIKKQADKNASQKSDVLKGLETKPKQTNKQVNSLVSPKGEETVTKPKGAKKPSKKALKPEANANHAEREVLPSEGQNAPKLTDLLHGFEKEAAREAKKNKSKAKIAEATTEGTAEAVEAPKPDGGSDTSKLSSLLQALGDYNNNNKKVEGQSKKSAPMRKDKSKKKEDKDARAEKKAQSAAEVEEPGVPLGEAENLPNLSGLLQALGGQPMHEPQSISDIFANIKVEKGAVNARPQLSKSISKDGDRYRKFLMTSPGLGIFSKETIESAQQQVAESLALYELLERERVENSMRTLPTNFFEEAMELTREGKLWNFPVNNEQGMEEEAKVKFHEHVFLERFLTLFPRKGPVRHFIELAMVGLSKNPYLTIQEKEDHIRWFADYFRDHPVEA